MGSLVGRRLGSGVIVALIVLAAAADAGANGATFTVVNTNDSGVGSLRQALLNANLTKTADRIEFAIGNGVQTIQIANASPLPSITSRVTIDGTTQPGYAAFPTSPVIHLKGDGSGLYNCLTVDPGGERTTIEGLLISDCDRGVAFQDGGRNTLELSEIKANNQGVDVDSPQNLITGNVIHANGADGIEVNAGKNVIVGNKLGTQANGTTGDGNGNGLDLGGDQARVEGNLISANGDNGIEVEGARNLIIDNRIGTNAAGTGDLGNGTNGIELFGPGAGNKFGAPGHGNLVSGNGANGIYVQSQGTIVQANFVGTDVTGTVALGNDDNGISQSALDGLIGGSKPGTGNVISGNGFRGIEILAQDIVIAGNLIGTTADGTTALGNGEDGVHITGGAGIVIGGAKTAAHNVLSGNAGDGVHVQGNANAVQGNMIGTNALGSAAVPNAGAGVSAAGQNNTIGGTRKGAGNLISGNTGVGVTVSPAATGDGILGNRILANGGLGIDLAADGVTANDSGDGDTGSNNLQNYPTLASVLSSSKKTLVTGSLRSTALRSFRVELFANAGCDASTFGEGATLVATSTVKTDAGGDGPFSIVSKTVPGMGFYTATATDLMTGDTSEFSLCM